MQTASVADLRNHFRRVSAWIENGESVQIYRRGRPIARLVPEPPAGKTPVVWPDFSAQRREIWGSKVFSMREVSEMNAFEHEGDEG
jgi:antitoxin (DNA-binding transcriptional repressor) of toxin-antitoxin stability system